MDHSSGGAQHLWKYLVASPSRQVRELFLSTTILDFAVSSISIFEPIYLWQKGFSIPHILLFYLAIYGVYFLLQPLGGKVTRSRGYEHGIIFSTPFLILYYFSLFAISYSPVFLGVAVISLAIHKTLYWPGFHADFARFGAADHQGRELGALVFFLSLSSISGPIFGGLLIKLFGFPVLFVVVAGCILASNIPLLLTPERFVPRDLSYVDAYKRLLKPENRRLVLAHMGYGEEFVALVLWPIAMYGVVGHFATLGLIVTIGALFTAIVGFFIGRLTDTGKRRTLLRLGALLTAITWPARAAISAPASVLTTETLYRSARMAQGMPMLAMTYDRARQYSVTKTAILLEMAVVMGKCSAAFFAFLAFSFFPEHAWTMVYFLATGYTLLYLVF